MQVFRAQYVELDGKVELKITAHTVHDFGRVQHADGSRTNVEQRKPLGWMVTDMFSGPGHMRRIPLCGEQVVLTPFPHQPEWAMTKEEVEAKMAKQMAQRRSYALREVDRQFKAVERMRVAAFLVPDPGEQV